MHVVNCTPCYFCMHAIFKNFVSRKICEIKYPLKFSLPIKGRTLGKRENTKLKCCKTYYVPKLQNSDAVIITCFTV